jgi:lipopolysaccharide transport system ATP-binding protein
VSVLNDRLEVIEHATSGQDISVALEYDIRNSQKLENVIIQIAFTGAFGQPLFACLSRVAKDGVLTLNPGSRILCRIPRLPLLPGTYTFDIWCKVGETIEDWVVNAGKLSVAQGDYFGTGKLPPNVVGDFVVAHDWSVE